MVLCQRHEAIPKYSIDQLVGMIGSTRFLKVRGVDVNGGLIVYWCRACPGTKYFTLREEELRELV